MNPVNDIIFELTNLERSYFGLHPVENDWDKLQLSATIVAYFDQNKIVKIINYGWGYVEYDTAIDTISRQILIPKTARGKQQKLTVSRMLKIKGSGVQFSGSFLGGNIHVYDNTRNVFFIKSFAQDGDIKSYKDLTNWISKYIAKTPSNYFDWLTDQLTQRKLRVKIETGDIIAFKLRESEYGFARILANVFEDKKRNAFERNQLYWFHPRSLIVAPYAFLSVTQNVDIEKLIEKPTLPAVCIFDIDIYRGAMLIIGHKPLSESDKQIPFPTDAVTHVTLNITKKELEALMNR